MGCLQILLALALSRIIASRVEAAKHSLIVGTFSTNFLNTVEYDDDNGALSLVAKSENDATKLYGTDWNAKEPSFVSYDVSVSDPSNIKHEATIFGGGGGGGHGCAGSKSVFVAARRTAPLHRLRRLCTTTATRALQHGYFRRRRRRRRGPEGASSRTTRTHAGRVRHPRHGLSSPDERRFLFSADTAGHAIWTHAAARPGRGPVSGVRARANLAVHGSGRGLSQVAQYAVLFPLLRERAPTSGPTRWPCRRGAATCGQRTGRTTAAARGYVSGAVARQLFLLPTSTSGGFANSVAPEPLRFDDAVVALTDNSTGFVQIWHVERGLVASLDIEDWGGCCANAVWLN
ncbi:Lactonase, 7-bladed beta-propeller-domain-containing protein [Biscogniauxia mediterranea]|nr:Lactonase, 7-bladed beta-propeller-domain-containing protein [Biscogniauxia mediterranea]